MGKAAVFIDGGYFDHVLNQSGRPRVDYEKFADHISKPEERFRAYYYHCPPWQGNPPTPEQSQRLANFQAFVNTLNFLPRFAVREGRLQRIGEEYKQKGVDILLAVDLLKLAYTTKIDKAILVTGDSDFVPVVEGIEDAGDTTTLWYSPGLPVHRSLLEIFDERYQISKEILFKNLRP